MAYSASDKEQIDEIRQWWKEYGIAITIAVIIGLAIGLSWKYYKGYKNSKEDKASLVYQQMLDAILQKRYAAIPPNTKLLQDQYSGTVYATTASLMSARIDVMQKNFKAADQSLQWVVDHSKDAAYQQIARIRDARVKIQLNDAKGALTVLNKVNDKDYAPLIEDAKGEAYLALNDKTKAHAAFLKAQQGYKIAGLTNPFLNLRLSS